MTANEFDASRPSFVRSNPSPIRFNNILGNIGAPLRDGSLGFEQDEDEEIDVMLDQTEAEIQEVRRSDAERRVGMSSGEAIHNIMEECVVGPGRLSCVRV